LATVANAVEGPHADVRPVGDEAESGEELQQVPRILARERLAMVSAKTRTLADTIRAYAAVFFSVWPRIEATDYIHGVVIKSYKPWKPTRVRDLWCYHQHKNTWRLRREQV
jgi:hypothetical protein